MISHLIIGFRFGWCGESASPVNLPVGKLSPAYRDAGTPLDYPPERSPSTPKALEVRGQWKFGVRAFRAEPSVPRSGALLPAPI